MPDENNYRDLYGSQYVSPEDLESGKVYDVTFTAFEVLELYCRGKSNKKVTMIPKSGKRRFAINKTSAAALKRAWGPEFKDWLNKPCLVKRGLVNSKPAVLVSPKDGAGKEGE